MTNFYALLTKWLMKIAINFHETYRTSTRNTYSSSKAAAALWVDGGGGSVKKGAPRIEIYYDDDSEFTTSELIVRRLIPVPMNCPLS